MKLRKVILMSNKDIKLLVEYFEGLVSIPEELENLVERLQLINTINEAQLELIEKQEANQ